MRCKGTTKFASVQILSGKSSKSFNSSKGKRLGDHHRRSVGFLWAFGGEYKYELVIKHNLYITHILLYNMHLYAELNHCAKNGWYAVLHVYHCYYDEHL